LTEADAPRVGIVDIGTDLRECLHLSVCEYQRAEFNKKMLDRYVGASSLSPPPLTTAVIDIPSYDPETYLQGVRKAHKGAALRQARKAERIGATCRRFELGENLAGVAAVNRSMETRSGGPMRESYLRSAAELAQDPGADEQLCPVHFDHWWGCFDPEDQLLAYIRLRRNGNYALYAQILGHGSFLNAGVVYALHFAILEWILQADSAAAEGIDHLVYAAWVSGGEGLQRWKRGTLFAPTDLVLGGSA
jgi:hypothetical protein